WDVPSGVVRGLSTEDDNEICVPTVVARANRAKGTRWFMGFEAAEIAPTETVQVYRYWKAELFDENIGNGSLAELMEVGVQYFRWLLEQVIEAKPVRSIVRCPTRVCIPKLSDKPFAA